MNKSYDGYELSKTGKKPSALLVYLILERKARSKDHCLGRAQIISYINKILGTRNSVGEKTVSEAVGILKGLSVGEHPLIDFHSCGKKGYYLGNATSSLSEGEVLALLEAMEKVSPASAEAALESLAPLMKEEDLATIKEIRNLAKGPKQAEDPEAKDYFQRMSLIAQAIRQKRFLLFTHHYAYESNFSFNPRSEWDEFCIRPNINKMTKPVPTDENIMATPFALLEKNGRHFLLCGQAVESRDKDGRALLFFYDLENLKNVRLSPHEALLRLEDCEGGQDLDIGAFVRRAPSLHEGIFYANYWKAMYYTAVVYNENVLRRTRQLFGDCYKIRRVEEGTDQEGNQKKIYHLDLYLEQHSLMMWAFYFARGAQVIRGSRLLRLNLARQYETLKKAYGLEEPLGQ